MFFSHGARIIAALGLLFGIIQIVVGFAVANEWGGFRKENLGRYTTASSTGALIDRGTFGIIAAFALGTLAEIGLAIRKNRP